MIEYVTVWRDHEPTKLRWGVPVVRCKDCKFFIASNGWYGCDLLEFARPSMENGFCAWGERREQDDG